MTLVEVTVTFALLGIFLTCAAAIITMIAGQYYRVNGETYSKQVTDIIMEKISAEIEGAKYVPVNASLTDEEEAEIELANPVFSDDYTNVSVYDRTDTRVRLQKQDGQLVVEYYGFTDRVNPQNSRQSTVWKFDSGVYNGYSIEELYFVRGDKLDAFGDTGKYGFNKDDVTYGTDIVIVFMKLYHPKYEDYYTYRVMKMYYVEDTSEAGGDTQNTGDDTSDTGGDTSNTGNDTTNSGNTEPEPSP